MEPKFKIGETVRDIVSGFEGKIMARTEWFNGCNRYRLEPDHLNPDGEMIESQTVDEEQLERVEKKKIKVPKKRNGGDRPNDVRQKIMR